MKFMNFTSEIDLAFDGMLSIGQDDKSLLDVRKCNYYPFCIFLKEGIKVELISPSFVVFKKWLFGIQKLINHKFNLRHYRKKLKYN